MNIAEIEVSVLARQGLDRRIPDRVALERELAAWVAERDAARSAVDWRFSTDDARIRPEHPYRTL